MNSRRKLLLALAGGAIAPRLFAQPRREPVRVGYLSSFARGNSPAQFAAFKEGMLALGWKEGENYQLVERWGDNLGTERAEELARQIAASKPAVILASPNGPVRAALKAAPGVPIVMATGTDPVGWGFAASLARPGGMVTGNSNILGELSDKYAGLLLEAAPRVKRIGFLVQSQGPLRDEQMQGIRRVVKIHALDARIGEVKTVEEIEPALARFATEGVQALIVYVGPLLSAERVRISQTALKRRWPTIAFNSQFSDEGALMSYGPNFPAHFRRAAYFVDRILKGAKPGDLPFEEPTQIEMVINMKTAKAIGLNISQSLLIRADRVID